MTTFGQLLKADREAMGWSQDQLGKEMGVSQQTVGQWESDAAQPRRHRLEHLMKLLSSRLPGRSQLYAYWSGTNKTPTPPSMFVDPSIPPPRFPTPTSRGEVHMRLKDAIPDHLHKCVGRALQFGHQEKQYDYVSPAVIARVLPTTDGRPPLLGMAVMTVHLAIAATRHRNVPGPEPTVGLFVLTPDLPAVALKRLGSAVSDAHALGVEVIPVPDIETMGRNIEQLEAQYAEEVRRFAENNSAQEEWQLPTELPPGMDPQDLG